MAHNTCRTKVENLSVSFRTRLSGLSGRYTNAILLITVLLAVVVTPRSVATNSRLSVAPGTMVRLSSVGFLPGQQKEASIASPCTDFRVVDAKNKTEVLKGKITGPFRNQDTNEQLYMADFSALKKPGVYRLETSTGQSSVDFRVAADVFRLPFYAVVRGFYFWRCGTAVSGKHQGITYSHRACHLEDAWLDYVEGAHKRASSTGGWHDAGDYNKYVVNAGVTVGTMLLAWEQFQREIENIPLDLPHTTGRIPDYLNEVKWEMDWLLTMQAADGSVYHKVSTKGFGPAIQPEEEKTERFFAPWSSAATADFVAVAFRAARAFKPYDSQYASRCLDAAKKSFAFLKAHPENHPADLKEFKTGAYQTNDDDDRLWATAEAWVSTGDPRILLDFESQARRFSEKFNADWGWGNVKNLGMLTYLFSTLANRNSAVVDEIKAALVATADAIVQTSKAHGYRRTLGTTYYWGANGGTANTAVILQSANRISPKSEYVTTTLDAIAYLFGRNYYGRSFVTGVGANPPVNPHDRRSMDQPGARAWPGYLVGGGWPKAIDWKDESPIYQVNEIAINWNAALVYALASVLGQQ